MQYLREPGYDLELRQALFKYLGQLVEASSDGLVSSKEANEFHFGNEKIPIIVQAGIRKPKQLDAALAIRTTYTPPGKPAPYQDSNDSTGLILYKYRGYDPNHSDNRAMRAAIEPRVPLVYFVGINSARYLPIYPVYVEGENPIKLEFLISVGGRAEEFSELLDPAFPRRYSVQEARVRLHQPVFRARVIDAYQSACAMCHLRHQELLDAAHILPDTHPKGQPIVSNGIALCKLHHAAFDRNFIGIRPDYSMAVKRRLIKEKDGPMLLHGIQEMDGKVLAVPRSAEARPDRNRLDERFQEFLERSES